MRVEKDFLGELEIESSALYGVHSARARENFPDRSQFNLEWFKAMGLVKKACYLTYKKLKSKLSAKFDLGDVAIPVISDDVLAAMIKAADEISHGEHYEQFIVPGISGGAGTSINMNINEIVANRALVILGKNPGEYQFVDPIEHANIFQSTNDVVPTSLKLACIRLLQTLEDSINRMRIKIEELERKHQNTVRIGYTQMQEAVPTSYGKLFGTYQESLSRDWWRISKCFERIKVVNLGGSAIGSGITVPKYFIFEATDTLREISNLPITRSENLQDATCNLDTFVEVHGILKSHAVNLEKMSNDLRMLASDMFSHRKMRIPARQVGSSIMPGKINPVISEYAISITGKVYANDSMVSSFCSRGMLELNAYTPIIGHSILESLNLLHGLNDTLLENMLAGIELDSDVSDLELEEFYSLPSISTALVPHIGYNKAASIAKEMKSSGDSIIEVNRRMGLISESTLLEVLRPNDLLKLGYKITDILEGK